MEWLFIRRTKEHILSLTMFDTCGNICIFQHYFVRIKLSTLMRCFELGVFVLVSYLFRIAHVSTFEQSLHNSTFEALSRPTCPCPTGLSGESERERKGERG